MNNLIGVIISYIYFFGLLLISPYLPCKTLEGKRKFVHIMLGNWWILVLIFFDNVYAASIVPVTFIFINYVSLKRNRDDGLLSSLERKNQKSYGIVLYPVAMTILVWLSFYLKEIRIGGLGMIALAYGDGIAALVGKHYRYKPFTVWGNSKSISGSLGMFISTFVVTLLYLYVTGMVLEQRILLITMAIATVTTVVEVITPFGIDDLSVPLSAVAIYCLII